MISLVPAIRQTIPFTGSRAKALFRAMLRSWLAHHARLAEMRIGGL